MLGREEEEEKEGGGERHHSLGRVGGEGDGDERVRRPLSGASRQAAGRLLLAGGAAGEAFEEAAGLGAILLDAGAGADAVAAGILLPCVRSQAMPLDQASPPPPTSPPLPHHRCVCGGYKAHEGDLHQSGCMRWALLQ